MDPIDGIESSLLGMPSPDIIHSIESTLDSVEAPKVKGSAIIVPSAVALALYPRTRALAHNYVLHNGS